MSELAFNINGEAFEVPANATGWRVRRMRQKGSPEVVYGRDGMPLVLPISAQLDELRAEVDTTGRYRLDLVDQDNKALAGAPSGYVQVNFESAPASSEGPGPGALGSMLSFGKPSDNIVLESIRTQAMLAMSVVERFPQMMEAAATLLRAADGAGLPARPPMAFRDESEDDDAEDEDEEASAEQKTTSIVDLIQPMVGPAVQYVVTGLISGQLKLPGNLAEVLDWRKAAASGKKAKSEVAPTPATAPTTPAAETASAPEVPKMNLQNAAHFIAIQEALGSKDAEFARTAASQFSQAQLVAWMDKLGQLSVAEAVAEIRKEIAKANATGGAA
jgi:hypothetical protein